MLLILFERFFQSLVLHSTLCCKADFTAPVLLWAKVLLMWLYH